MIAIINMKTLKYILTLVLLQSIALLSASVVDIEDLSEYVYPKNSYNRVDGYIFSNDGESYFKLAEDGKAIVQYETKSGGEIGVVFDITNTRENRIDHIEGFSMSADGSKILVFKDSNPIYRHSFSAAYYVYEIKSRLLKPLSNKFKLQQAPLFSPDGRMVAFVAENNIYIKKLDYGSEVAVTTDGVINEIINGIPDWAYEEEFSTDISMVWAPDNTALSYIKYIEKDVPTFSFPIYKGACNPINEYALYPGIYSYKYPVAGEKNSIVSVHCYDVETRKTNNIVFTDKNIEYIPRISYAVTSQRLMVATLNRAQNRMELYAVNPKSTVVKSIYVDESKVWISPFTYEEITYLEDGFVIGSERSGYNHLYKYSYSGNLIKQLTNGDFNVTAYYGCDTHGNHYYQSTAGALNRVLKIIDKKGNTKVMSETDGTNTAFFSPNLNYYILNYNNVSTPPVYTLYNSSGKSLRVIEKNETYATRYSALPSKEFITINSDGNTLNGYMIKPIDFDAGKKYPVIMYQYSGPGSQLVLNRWEMDWFYYYAQNGYIIVCVDGRGTGGRERSFQDVVYKQLGRFETIDQLNVAKYISTLPYVDANKIGLYGWSYGGYEALMAASHPNSTFAAVVSVAPVADWRYYDTIYAERYMLTPNENEDGYNSSAPINMIENLNCELLLMSGTADDNVHFFNTLQYVSEMQMTGKYCDMFIFPNMNHSINGCNARAVIYAKMLDFFNKNLK